MSGMTWNGNRLPRCRTGSSEILRQGQLQGPSPTTSSLPHRQLRNRKRTTVLLPTTSLPHRQLRKMEKIVMAPRKASLPHRQLRKSDSTACLIVFILAAAQAAQKNIGDACRCDLPPRCRTGSSEKERITSCADVVPRCRTGSSEIWLAALGDCHFQKDDCTS